MRRLRARDLCAVLALVLAPSCGAKPNRTRDAAIVTGAAVAAAGVYRATSGGCWAQCAPGLVCDRKSGTCVESVRRGAHPAAPAANDPARAAEQWWTAGDAACPDGSRLDTNPSAEGDRVITCVQPDGTLHGRATFFYGNGKREMEGEYRAGRPVGVWRHWDADGRPSKTEDLGEHR